MSGVNEGMDGTADMGMVDVQSEAAGGMVTVVMNATVGVDATWIPVVRGMVQF